MGTPILRTENLTKRFVGVTVNDAINLELHRGEVMAIIGENGAGKSTFCKMITGVYQPDEGAIYIDGQEVHFRDARDSMESGIGMVYQERNLVPMLTGAQNICLGANAVKGFLLKEKEIRQNALEIRDKLQLSVPLDVPIERLGAGEQQIIEILRALYVQPKLLILDEPTASLGEAEITPFLNFVKQMTKTMDIAVIFISHKIEEVFEVANRIAVFTDGHNVLTENIENLTQEQCIRAMLRNGEIAELEIKEKPYDAERPVVVRCEGGSYDNKEHKLDFVGYEGEVVGCYGLVGSGRTEMAEAMFGLRKAKLTGFDFGGEPVRAITPLKMIDRGMVLTPERRADGLFPTLSLVDNICNLFLGKKLTNRAGFINFKQCNTFSDQILKENNVKYSSRRQAISELSGGNIQKIIIGRAVAVEGCHFVVVDEPTTGMDIGAKHEVYHHLRELADKEDKCVLFISSELEELLGVCDRLYVFADGNIVDCFLRKDFVKSTILDTAVRGRKVR